MQTKYYYYYYYYYLFKFLLIYAPAFLTTAMNVDYYASSQRVSIVFVEDQCVH
jgi:hypothetical protein